MGEKVEEVRAHLLVLEVGVEDGRKGVVGAEGWQTEEARWR